MKRTIDGYTFEITEVSDGFSITVTMPNSDKHIAHSYIRSYAITKAHKIIEQHRGQN